MFLTDSTVVTPTGSKGRRFLGWRLILPAVSIAFAILMCSGLPREFIGAAAIGMMLALMAMRVPIGIAMAVPSILGVYLTVGPRAAEGMLSRIAFETTASWTLTVIPMFVLMGALLSASGLTQRIYAVARDWLGWMPGGLAAGTNVAGAGFAALSGSTLSSIYPLARAGVPEMLRAGYDRRVAIASVMASGTLAHLIPPSLFLVLYAGVAQVPVGPQLIAGVVPGLLLLALYIAASTALGVLRPALVGGKGARVSVPWSTRLRGLRGILIAPLLVVVVVAGLYSGLFTATEAGAVGAFGALLIALWMLRRKQPARETAKALLETVSTVASVFLLLIGAYMFTLLMSVSGLADAFVSVVIEIDPSRVAFLVLMMVVYIILGTFLDAVAMMLLTVPILLPILTALEISPIWFGVFVVVFMELAVLTPPVGVLSFVVHGIVQDKRVNLGQPISLGDVFVAVGWLLIVPLTLIVIIIAAPDIVTWLPSRME